MLALFEETSAWAREKNPIRLVCDSIEILKRMVEENRGITILPWLAVAGKAHANPELVRKITSPAPRRTVRLLYLRRLEHSSLIRSLAASILQVARPLLPPEQQVSAGSNQEEPSAG